MEFQLCGDGINNVTTELQQAIFDAADLDEAWNVLLPFIGRCMRTTYWSPGTPNHSIQLKLGIWISTTIGPSDGNVRVIRNRGTYWGWTQFRSGQIVDPSDIPEEGRRMILMWLLDYRFPKSTMNFSDDEFERDTFYTGEVRFDSWAGAWPYSGQWPDPDFNTRGFYAIGQPPAALDAVGPTSTCLAIG
jgi:hypothetical protein